MNKTEVSFLGRFKVNPSKMRLCFSQLIRTFIHGALRIAAFCLKCCFSFFLSSITYEFIEQKYCLCKYTQTLILFGYPKM